jgi:hypothetical protein
MHFYRNNPSHSWFQWISWKLCDCSTTRFINWPLGYNFHDFFEINNPILKRLSLFPRCGSIFWLGNMNKDEKKALVSSWKFKISEFFVQEEKGCEVDSPLCCIRSFYKVALYLLRWLWKMKRNFKSKPKRNPWTKITQVYKAIVRIMMKKCHLQRKLVRLVFIPA